MIITLIIVVIITITIIVVVVVVTTISLLRLEHVASAGAFSCMHIRRAGGPAYRPAGRPAGSRQDGGKETGELQFSTRVIVCCYVFVIVLAYVLVVLYNLFNSTLGLSYLTSPWPGMSITFINSAVIVAFSSSSLLKQSLHYAACSLK